MESGSGSNEQTHSTATSEEKKEKRRRCDSLQFETKRYQMAPLVIEECNSSSESLVLSGTACKGGIAPTIGDVDIGVSKSAYYFRVALPGVKEDPDTFSCKAEESGKIHIRGVTSTGVETVSRYPRIFKMKIQNQLPTGPFSVIFRLPGHVDTRCCAFDFRSGIFEAVVWKLLSGGVV